MKKEGSFLIETIIYIALTILLASLVYKSVAYSVQYYRGLHSRIINNINLLKSIHDLIRDIELANPELKNWKVETNRVLFMSNNFYIEWFARNGNLYRTEWSTKQQNTKKRKVKNLMTKNVKNLNCELKQKDNIVQSVYFEIIAEKRYEINIKLINGIYEIK